MGRKAWDITTPAASSRGVQNAKCLIALRTGLAKFIDHFADLPNLNAGNVGQKIETLFARNRDEDSIEARNTMMFPPVGTIIVMLPSGE
jgi:hypothetical protein